jgi:predicted DNA-binding protein (MmcQ/YjbR family)
LLQESTFLKLNNAHYLVSEYLLEKLESDVDFSMDFIDNNTVKGYADGIKVDLLAHKYPLINKVLKIEELRIASMDDISAMKVNSSANDGTRVKDFMNFEEIRKYCLAKPGVTEDFPFNDTALVFKVAGKMFALLDLSEDSRSISLKCDPELAIELREQHREVTPAYHLNNKEVLLISLNCRDICNKFTTKLMLVVK